MFLELYVSLDSEHDQLRNESKGKKKKNQHTPDSSFFSINNCLVVSFAFAYPEFEFKHSVEFQNFWEQLFPG